MITESQRAALARAALALVLGAGGPAAWAQATPPATLPNVQQLTPPLPRADADVTSLPTPSGRPAPALERPAEGLRLDVSGFDADGAPPALQAALAALTAPYVGPGRSHEDLLAAAAAVTRYLQLELGYYLGHAYVPAQRPVGGRVRLQVLEGRLDRVVLQWADGIAVEREVVEAHLAQLQPGSVLRLAEVERVVLLLNDLPGVATRFEFREGRDWGTAELLVQATPEAAWHGRGELDSDGSRYTGVMRLGGQLQRAGPFGRGDALSLGAQVSGTGGLAFVLAGYTLPLGGDGFRLGASLSAFRYRFDRDLMPQEVRGRASAATLSATHPLRRSRDANAFVLVSFDHKRFTDTQGDGGALASRKHSHELRAGLSGDWRDDTLGGASSDYELTGSAGRIGFAGAAPAGSDDARRFGKLGFGLSRLQSLVPGRLLLHTQLRGQHAFSNLDATQQFRLGGADGVRAFAPGEAAGDSGLLLSVELRVPLPEGGVGRGWMGSVFYDRGRVRLRHDASQRPAGFDNQASLGGAGLGLVRAAAGGSSARLFLSWPTLGRATGDTAERRPRVNALVTFSFP